MADYRQVHTKMWTDEWFLELEPEAKLLWIYLFSNKRACLAGLYDIPMRLIMFETGLAQDTIKRWLGHFREAGKAFYEDGWVLVPNLMRYNAHNFTSTKILANIKNDVIAAPNIPLKRRWLDHFNAAVPPDEKGCRMSESDIGYSALPDTPLDTLSDTVSDTPSDTASTEQEHISQEQSTNGADAPLTFSDWQGKFTEASNKQGFVGYMLQTLYEPYYKNHRAPNYGFIGTLLSKHDPDYLLSLVWQHSARPPTGDPLKFIAGILSKDGGPKRGDPVEPAPRKMRQITAGGAS